MLVTLHLRKIKHMELHKLVHSHRIKQEQSSCVVYRAEYYLESELSILSAVDIDLQADVLNVSQELCKSSFILTSLNTTAAMSRENQYLV